MWKVAIAHACVSVVAQKQVFYFLWSAALTALWTGVTRAAAAHAPRALQGGGGGGGVPAVVAAPPPAPAVIHVGGADLVDVPAVFNASGGGARLNDGGFSLEGSKGAWATLGGLVERGVLVWRFRVESERVAFGVITGAEAVPADWRHRKNARGYEIVSASNGWVDLRVRRDIVGRLIGARPRMGRRSSARWT
jgi:hypothetical protein